MSWRKQAACVDAPAHLFFPPPKLSHDNSQAKAICAGCPVRETCLEAAVAEEAGGAIREIHGIRGGLTAEERILDRRIHDLPPTCKNGHARTAENTRVMQQQVVCMDCRKAISQAYSERSRLKKERLAQVASFLADNPHLDTHCGRGHEYTPETTGLRGLRAQKPRRVCLTCEQTRVARPKATHCMRGHPWDEENTYTMSNGKRFCRACQRIRNVKRRDRRKKEAVKA